MLSPKDVQFIKICLAKTEAPDKTFSYDELLGYIFGIAMTPELIMPSQWFPIIFGSEEDNSPDFESPEEAESMYSCLLNLYNDYLDQFTRGTLAFPFDIDNLTEDKLEQLYEWASGFDEALFLRNELWDPEEYPDLPEKKVEKLYQAMMTIEGLVNSTEVFDFFHKLPKEVFEETFPGMDDSNETRELQTLCFLISALPSAVENLLEHAQWLEKKRKRGLRGHPDFGQVFSNKTSRNKPCPCGSGKKYKKCCGKKEAPSEFSDEIFGAASNVIQVDFSKKKK